MENLKNMLVIKDLPSNLIEEAYVVLNPNLKAKMNEVEKNLDKIDSGKQATNSRVARKNYILEEAKYVLLNYVSKYETKFEKVNNKLLEKKYKNLKKITIGMSVTFLIYVIITNLFR